MAFMKQMTIVELFLDTILHVYNNKEVDGLKTKVT